MAAALSLVLASCSHRSARAAHPIERLFAGAVTDIDGGPVDGIEVQLYSTDVPSNPACAGRNLLFDECRLSDKAISEMIRSGSYPATPLAKVTTADGGAFSATVAATAVDLVAVAPGLGAAVALDVRPGNAVAVELRPPAEVRAVLTRETTTEQPVEPPVIQFFSGRPRMRWQATAHDEAARIADVPQGLRLVAVLDLNGYELERSQFEPPEQADLWLIGVHDIHGTITDGNGRPVLGATVWAERAFDATATTTSAAGTFTVERVKRYGTLCAFKGQLAGAVEAQGWNDADISLQPSFSLTVDVRDAASDKPVRGARVDGFAGMERSKSGHGSMMKGGLPEARFADEAPGLYVAHHLLPGPVTVQALAKDYLFSGAQTVVIEASDARWQFRLERGELLRGSVVSADGDRPLPRASVGVLNDRGGLETNVFTDDAGAFSIAARAGQRSFTIGAPDHLPAQTSVALPHPDPLLVKLEPASVILVSLLLPNGEPAPDAEVVAELIGDPPRELGLDNERPDATGRLRIPGVAAGAYRLWAEQAGYSPSDPVSIEVRKGTTPVTLRLKPGLAVRGVVRDQRGKPAPGRELAIDGTRVVSGPDGRFEVHGLAPGEHNVGLPIPGRPWMTEALPGSPKVTAGDDSAIVVLPAEGAFTPR